VRAMVALRGPSYPDGHNRPQTANAGLPAPVRAPITTPGRENRRAA
jgi:hypothetical protein